MKQQELEGILNNLHFYKKSVSFWKVMCLNIWKEKQNKEKRRDDLEGKN